MPKISLIIPLYNAGLYIKECLDSVKMQTFSDFECLLINDCSTDNTQEIIENETIGDERFKIFINEQNQGVSFTRNRGMELAAAPYLMFLDQDDMFHPQAMEFLYNIITTSKTDVAAFNFQTVSDDFVMNNPPVYKFNEHAVKVSDTPFRDFFKNKKGANVMMWVRIYRKEAIKGIEFPVGVQPAEDSVFTVKVMHQIKSIAKVELPLLYYRDSSISVMNQGRNEKYLNAHLKAGEIIYDYFLGNNILKDEMRKKMEYYVARFFYKTCLSQILRQVPDKEKQHKMLETAKNNLNELYAKGKFRPQYLGLKKCLAAKCFLNGCFGIARVLV